MSLGRGQFDPGRLAELAPSYLFEGLAAESFRMRSLASLPPSAAAVPCHESKALVVIGQRDKKPPALLSSAIRACSAACAVDGSAYSTRREFILLSTLFLKCWLALQQRFGILRAPTLVSWGDPSNSPCGRRLAFCV